MTFDRILLASASPRRTQYLIEMGLRFEVKPSAIVEWEDPSADPKALVQHNAYAKAKHVLELSPQSLVLGADTASAFNNTVFNKPATKAEAFDMLKALSGSSHITYTAYSLQAKAPFINVCEIASSIVHMKHLTDEIIWSYIEKVDTLSKAGACSILEHPDMIIAGYEGELATIAGLPVESLTRTLQQLSLWDGLRVENKE